MLGGVASGIYLGLHFHKNDWLGGYSSFRRRLLRLGHISFFGIGFVNLMFAFTLRAMPVAAPYGEIGAFALATAAIAMPLTCFLAAWQPKFRELFPIPVVGLLTGIVAVLAGRLA